MLPEHSTKRTTYREEVESVAREHIEEAERRARAWKLMEDMIIGLRAQRDEMLTILRRALGHTECSDCKRDMEAVIAGCAK